MTRKILILGASYGSLLGTKLLMAGHDVTLVCRTDTADLINAEGTEVCIKLKGEETHRAIHSKDLPGNLDAQTPQHVNPGDYDMVALAMQEPQYSAPEIRILMRRIALTEVPCLSIMNMPPLPYLRRIAGLDVAALEPAYADASVWDAFRPGLMSLCSPDPQAFRPPEEANNVLHVGLPTNLKAARFEADAHNEMLAELEASIAAVTLDGKDVPVKLRVHASLFVPLAKWAMLLTGNYRCVMLGGTRSIRDAVHTDEALSRSVYNFVNTLAERMGASPFDQVAFNKYARAAESLMKPSSAARAITSGAVQIERVDRLVQLLGEQIGVRHPMVDAIVRVVNVRLVQNQEAKIEALPASSAA